VAPPPAEEAARCHRRIPWECAGAKRVLGRVRFRGE
jgi:hypothetical protein